MPKIYRVELTSNERSMLPDMVRRRSRTARPVVCLDETRKQLVSETRRPFTDSRGELHVDYEYTTTNTNRRE